MADFKLTKEEKETIKKAEEIDAKNSGRKPRSVEDVIAARLREEYSELRGMKSNREVFQNVDQSQFNDAKSFVLMQSRDAVKDQQKSDLEGLQDGTMIRDGNGKIIPNPNYNDNDIETNTPVYNPNTEEGRRKMQEDADRIANQQQQQQQNVSQQSNETNGDKRPQIENPSANTSILGSAYSKVFEDKITLPALYQISDTDKKAFTDQVRKDAWAVTATGANMTLHVPQADGSKVDITIPAGKSANDLTGKDRAVYEQYVNSRVDLINNNIDTLNLSLRNRMNTLERMNADGSGYSNTEILTYINGGVTSNSMGDSKVTGYTQMVNNSRDLLASNASLWLPHPNLIQPNNGAIFIQQTIPTLQNVTASVNNPQQNNNTFASLDSNSQEQVDQIKLQYEQNLRNGTATPTFVGNNQSQNTGRVV